MYPRCRVVGSSLPGRDLLETGPFAPEIKATRDPNFVGFMRQAKRNANGDIPVCVWRPNGYGPEQIDDWLVILYQGDFLGLVKRAGLGSIQKPTRRTSTKQPTEGAPVGGGERLGRLDNPGYEDVQGAVHTLLSLLGVDVWEVQIRQREGGDS